MRISLSPKKRDGDVADNTLKSVEIISVMPAPGYIETMMPVVPAQVQPSSQQSVIPVKVGIQFSNSKKGCRPCNRLRLVDSRSRSSSRRERQKLWQRRLLVGHGRSFVYCKKLTCLNHSRCAIFAWCPIGRFMSFFLR